tara:strand:+ start:2397 stop:3410 length:1014 start_codon:yes stop_codon:yes gene_type:complete
MHRNNRKVLVTGASGFIALHCIKELLKNGYNVKGSLRNLKKESQVRNALREVIKDDNFEICKLDLLQDDGWYKETSDCDYLMHIASPCVIREPNNEEEVIVPAVKGTLRALEAAHNSNIKKVVITSSIGSMVYGHNKYKCFPDDWTNVSAPIGAYIKSKTLADQASWDFLARVKNISFSMTSIHPGMVFGPLLNNQIQTTSADLIMKIIKGKFPALPNIFFSVVDVRDVAKIHVDSLSNKKSDYKRIISSSPNVISLLEISRILRNLGYQRSTLNLVPNQLINLLAIFNKDMRTSASMIKRGSFKLDISETLSIYDWNPIPFEKTIIDMTNSLKDIC